MDEWVWSNGGMILTAENWSTGRKTLYSVGGRWMNEYGAMVEWYWQGKTEVVARNLPHYHFVHNRFLMNSCGIESDPGVYSPRSWLILYMTEC